MLMSILLWILKIMWWLFKATGFAAMMFCFASLVGYSAGVMYTKHPGYAPKSATKTELVLWAIMFAIVGSIPVLNWMIALAIFALDKEFVHSMISEMEDKHGFQSNM